MFVAVESNFNDPDRWILRLRFVGIWRGSGFVFVLFNCFLKKFFNPLFDLAERAFLGEARDSVMVFFQLV